MLPGLLNQISPDEEIGSVTADGAYTQRNATILERFVHAAMCCMNDRISRRSAALEFSQAQQFPRCERTQHKTQIFTLGSILPFAACSLNGSMR